MSLEQVGKNLDQIKDEIRQEFGEDRLSSLQIVAVSKKQPFEKLEALYHHGHRDFGENYVQELKEKAEAFLEKGISDIRWHFLGNLQKNKVKMLLPYVYSIHAVDSVSLLREIEKRKSDDQDIQAFLQVNIDEEETKSGLSPSELSSFFEEIKKGNFSIQGLMCIPDPQQKDSFQRLVRLRDQFLDSSSVLSMGMSSDYMEAIRQGSTHVRIGTSIFGARSV